MRLQERDRRILGLGLLVALAIVGWTYVISPMQQRWRAASASLKSARTDLAKLQRIADQSRYYAGQREEVAKMVIQTPDLAAAQRVVPVMINQIEDLRQRRRIVITRYEPLPPKVEEAYALYSLNLAFHSDLGALVDFLQDIRNAKPVINIKRLHVTPPGPDAKIKDLTAEMLLEAVAIERPPQTAGAPGREAG